jgi:AcrR family transcriptional regulator
VCNRFVAYMSVSAYATNPVHTGGMKVAGERLDPRQARTRERVYAAALDVLRREGIGATTFDAIAQHAGVARSTLYRNWSSRDALPHEAIEEQAPFPVTPPDEPTVARLETTLQQIATALSASSWGWVLPAAIAATDASPVLSEGYRSFTAGLRAVFTTIVNDGKKAGELPPDLDEENFADTLLGPLFYRRLIRQLPTGPTWIRDHLQRTLSAFGALT